MYKYGVFSGPYFFELGLNPEIYGVNLRIQSKYRKMQIRKKSVFGHVSSSEFSENFIASLGAFQNLNWT